MFRGQFQHTCFCTGDLFLFNVDIPLVTPVIFSHITSKFPHLVPRGIIIQ